MKSRKDLTGYLKSYFEQNSSNLGIEMAFLFGSWARGIPREDSDIDIAVVFSEEYVSEEEVFNRLTDMSVSLSKELQCDPNMIQIEKDFRKPLLYYNAIALGLLFFVKDFTKYVRLKNEALYQMEDYSMFGIGWQYRVTEKNLEALKHA